MCEVAKGRVKPPRIKKITVLGGRRQNFLSSSFLDYRLVKKRARRKKMQKRENRTFCRVDIEFFTSSAL